MAKVFLSYDRDDTERARPVALALEKAGHFVWWDLHIRGGEQFSKVIDEALRAADAVVVLWSKYSIESPWVRDEAAAGRDSGRLIPVSLDDTQPPLGFRQYQTIDLSSWKGRGKPAQLQSLFSDVEAISRKQPSSGNSPMPPTVAQSVPNMKFRRWTLIAGIFLVLAPISYAAWRLVGPSGAPPTVAVEASESSAPSQALARDLFVKLGSLQSSNADAVRLVSGGTAAGPALIFEVAGNAEAQQPYANLVLLNGKDRSLFWSKEFSAPAGRGADLRQQLGFTSARMASCAAEALTEGSRLDQGSLKLYLNACATLTDIGWDRRPVLQMLRQVVQKAPEFRPAWAKLIVAEADVIPFLKTSGEPAEGAMAQLRADIRRATEIDPAMAEVSIAEISLMPRWTISGAVALVEKAKSQDPDNPVVLSARSETLQLVGRMQEAIEDADRAAQLDPLSPQTRTALIRALAYGGSIERARREQERAQQLWPGTQTIRDSEEALERRFGNFQKLFATEETDPAGRSYVTARLDPSDANVQHFLAAVGKEGFDVPHAVFTLQALGEMNRVDEFYDLAERPGIAEAIRTDTYALFRPWLANARRDPRFIRLAKRLGLVDYWRSSGKWPDYCSDPSLPYDCKAEAAKLRK